MSFSLNIIMAYTLWLKPEYEIFYVVDKFTICNFKIHTEMV